MWGRRRLLGWCHWYILHVRYGFYRYWDKFQHIPRELRHKSGLWAANKKPEKLSTRKKELLHFETWTRQNNNYLINFFFYYGNYDNKNKVPKFDVYVGVNYMFTVVLDRVYITFLANIIHVPTSDIIYVCLINTGFGIPFISALELRPLDKSLYPFGFGALLGGWRFDLGTTKGRQEYYIR